MTTDIAEQTRFIKAALNCAILATADRNEVMSLDLIEKLLKSAAELCPDFTRSSEHFKKLTSRFNPQPRS